MTSRTEHNSGLHHHHLHVPGSTVVHRLAPEVKIVGLVAFAMAVAVTPRRAIWAFAIDAAVVIGVLLITRLRPRLVLTRLAVVVPFVAFAVFVPFVAGGREVAVAGVGLSVDGLWATWNIVTKAVLGASASIVLSATTSVPDLLHGLTRLRTPAVIVSITSFMFRYLDLLSDQLRRMRTSMVARAYDPRWLWQAKPIAASAGALFVRSYERGERIHNAMLSRGFTGTMPELHHRRADRRQWITAIGPALIAVVALLSAVVIGQ